MDRIFLKIWERGQSADQGDQARMPQILLLSFLECVGEAGCEDSVAERERERERERKKERERE
jgi:hypothetical protein